MAAASDTGQRHSRSCASWSSTADLCGLKWRRLSSEQQGPSLGGGGPHRGGGGVAADPLSEPVLSSFAKCLAADLLCVWRRVARPELPHRRELWVFWYGEEPDLAGLVSPELNVGFPDA
ncbi:hypothetical protein IscW_ISCW022895 [Ixodes scapularis]|uniref:Mediator of RNA polymerase II transcription subunit 13 n=1 Tax=Ixodes scapularis TaxID=6945 RepID=B7QD65_IXOSC|nr:hypothetical protein IscW_ISCW022895 [Ixodes scapularis]|eukprot:XP_002413479.1 hypothetical protein IscW_ISCW022895 [Ixodes scapularis]